MHSLLSLRPICSVSDLKAYRFDHMRKLWSHAQSEHGLIVFPFTLLTVCDVTCGSKTQPLATVTRINNYC